MDQIVAGTEEVVDVVVVDQHILHTTKSDAVALNLGNFIACDCQADCFGHRHPVKCIGNKVIGKFDVCTTTDQDDLLNQIFGSFSVSFRITDQFGVGDGHVLYIVHVEIGQPVGTICGLLSVTADLQAIKCQVLPFTHVDAV